MATFRHLTLCCLAVVTGVLVVVRAQGPVIMEPLLDPPHHTADEPVTSPVADPTTTTEEGPIDHTPEPSRRKRSADGPVTSPVTDPTTTTEEGPIDHMPESSRRLRLADPVELRRVRSVVTEKLRGKCSRDCQLRCREANHRDGECQGKYDRYRCVCFH